MKKLLLLLLLFCFKLSGQTDSINYPPVDYPENYTADINATYTEVDGWKGRVDVYYPKDTGKSVPLVINIH